MRRTPDDDSTDEYRARETIGALRPLLGRVSAGIEMKHYGRSMEPAIPNGATVRIQCDAPLILHPGAVVAVQTDDGVVTHRVVHVGHARRAQGMIVTRGDSRRIPDPPIEIARTVGVVSDVSWDGVWKPVSSTSERVSPRWVRACDRLMVIALETHPNCARLFSWCLNRVRYARSAWKRRRRST